MRDGFRSLRVAVYDLMDKVPTTVGTDPRDPLPARVEESLRGISWIEDAAVRLREERHVYCGEIYVVPSSSANLLSGTEEVRELASSLDCCLQDMTVMMVTSLESGKSTTAA